mgnify:FL=1
MALIKTSAQGLTADATNLVLLNTTTVSSATSSVDFDSSLITDTYKTYKMVVSDVVGATDSNTLCLRLSADNGSNITSSGYNRALALVNDGTSSNSIVTRGGDANQNNIFLAGDVSLASNVSTETMNCDVTLYGLRDTAFKKVVSITSYTTDTSRNAVGLFSGELQNSANINFVRILMSSGNITKGRFTLYGVKS